MIEKTTRSFGCPLKYIQGPDEFENIAVYTEEYGKAMFIIDAFLFESLKSRLDRIYEKAGLAYEALPMSGECCNEFIDEIMQSFQKSGADVIVGVGGGKTMDTSKICAGRLSKPLIIVPTSASTDAPVSEIAVLYQPDGVYIGSQKMKHNANLILVDTKIIVGAPTRLFVAGIADALATYPEALACRQSDSPNYIGEGNRRCIAGMAVAKACWDTIFADGRAAVLAQKKGIVTEAFENVVEANTLLSGLGFLNTGLSCAHGIHSGLTAVESAHSFLHGEKVAFGIVVQMVLENTPAGELDKVMRFMVDIGMPVTLEQLNVEPTIENITAIAEKTVGGPLVHHEPFAVTFETVYNAIVLADELGKQYLSGKGQQCS